MAGLNNDFSPSGASFRAFATDSAYGPLLATAAAIALGLRLARGQRTPALYALLAVLLVFWIALAMGVGPGRDPSTIRYTFGGAVVTFLIGAEASSGLRRSATTVLVLYAVIALAVCGNLARLRTGAEYFRSRADTACPAAGPRAGTRPRRAGLRAAVRAGELRRRPRGALPGGCGPQRLAGLQPGRAAT